MSQNGPVVLVIHAWDLAEKWLKGSVDHAAVIDKLAKEQFVDALPEVLVKERDPRSSEDAGQLTENN